MASTTKAALFVALSWAAGACSSSDKPASQDAAKKAAATGAATGGATAGATATTGNATAATGGASGTATDGSVQQPPSPPPGPAPSPPANLSACAGAQTSKLSADITSDQKLTGTITVTKQITIASGVKVTADQCASFALAAGAGFNVAGSLTVVGKADGLVPFQPADGASAWSGIKVLSGGTASLTSVYITKGQVGLECQTGAAGCVLAGSTLVDNTQPLHVSAKAAVSDSLISKMGSDGILIEAGADATITNSAMYDAKGDLIVVNGGRVVMSRVKVGGIGYQHCGIHINDATHFEVRDSELAGNYFAFMVGATAQLIVKGNNIRQSMTSHMLSIGSPIPSPDISGNYWEVLLPANPGLPADFLVAAGVTTPNSSGSVTTALPNLGPTIKVPASLALTGGFELSGDTTQGSLLGRYCPQ